jgi:hypothetical protein
MYQYMSDIFIVTTGYNRMILMRKRSIKIESKVWQIVKGVNREN